MYRIFNVVPERFKTSEPCSINYKIDTTVSLLKDTTFDKGRNTNVLYCDFTMEEVLEVSIVYNSNTGDSTYPLSRVTTRKWFDDSGVNHNILGFDKTVKTKKYNVRQEINEGITRRNNIVDHLFSTASNMGYTTEASNYIKTYDEQIHAYTLVHDLSILTTVANDTGAWLSDFVPDTGDTITMKMLILDALTV